jgi:hypothetical protein
MSYQIGQALGAAVLALGVALTVCRKMPARRKWTTALLLSATVGALAFAGLSVQ